MEKQKRELTCPITAAETTPLNKLGKFPLSENDKERLQKLYPPPWSKEANNGISPIFTLENAPLNEITGFPIPESQERNFYTLLYGDPAVAYYKGLDKANLKQGSPDSNENTLYKRYRNSVPSYIPGTFAPHPIPTNPQGNMFIPNSYMYGLYARNDNNDADTADIICQILRDKYIYTEEAKCYYMWNDRIWEKKHPLEFKKEVIDILQNRYKFVSENQTNVDLNYIRKGCDNKKIDDLISIINTKIYKNEKKLNNDKGLLCVRNGVYDMVRKCMHPHIEYKERYITRIIDVPYSPNTSYYNGIFHNFIMDIMSGDIALADFLQRAFGYALIGNPIEQKCIMLVGNGANGKTTLIEAISNLLGNDYCTSMSKKVLMNEDAGSANNASPSIMQLRGKRMAFTSELKRNERIVESQFKKIIGGGKLTGRALYKDMTEFENETTVFIDTNHLPSIETAGSSSEYAIFRRIEIVPFKRMFSEEERDPNLPDLLQTELVQREILAWLIEGTVKYYTNKLLPTEEMLLIKQRFMQSENSILRFSEACIYKTNCDKDFVSSRSLYECYLEFCNQNGFDEIGSTLFFKSEVISGLKRHRTSKERGYSGIQLIQK